MVLGLNNITGLQTARLLAARGVPVIGVAPERRHFACRTRVLDRFVEAPTSGVGAVSALERLGPELAERAVLYPCTDPAVLTVARNRERLARWYHIGLPDANIVDLLSDKVRFGATAEALGLRLPATRVLTCAADVERAAAELRFPLILKPAVRTEAWDRASPAKVHRVASPEALTSIGSLCFAWTDALVVQEWIDGPDSELYTCYVYLDRTGEVAVSYVARKLRQWPPLAGTTSLGEECRDDAALEIGLRLLRGAGHRGLGAVEVKRDRRTGEYYVLEANVGRPTGRSAIVEAGGVELLLTMYRDLLGLPLPAERVQRYTGARWIYWRQDLRSALHYWRRGELTALDWLRSVRGRKATAVFSWRDPLPFLADLAALPARAPAARRRAAWRAGAMASREPAPQR